MKNLNKKQKNVLYLSLLSITFLFLFLGILLLIVGFAAPIFTNEGGETTLQELLNQSQGQRDFFWFLKTVGNVVDNGVLFNNSARSRIQTAGAGFSFMIISIPFIIACVSPFVYRWFKNLK